MGLQLWARHAGGEVWDLYWIKPDALNSDADFIPCIYALSGMKTETLRKGRWSRVADYSKETL